MIETLPLVLHLLVLAYWLGGDIGAFVASFLLTNKTLDPAQRMAAARLVNHVDMSPKSCLILALPTGLWLADSRFWIDLPDWALLLVWMLALAWLGLLWRQHLAGANPVLTRIDMALRIVFAIGLGATGIAGLTALLTLPVIIAVKLVLLSLIVCLGLLIRRALTPLGGALGALASGTVTDEANAAITSSLGLARFGVVLIWCLLLAATWLGASL